MTKKITIAIDAMGGDNSPDKTIEGVGLFLEKRKNDNDILLNLFGDEEKIKEKLIKYNIPTDKIQIKHTTSTVSDEETPLTAVKNSKNTKLSLKNRIETPSIQQTYDDYVNLGGRPLIESS